MVDLKTTYVGLQLGNPIIVSSSGLLDNMDKVPLIAKVSPYFSNLIYMVNQFHAIGLQGVVLFNRLYEPDIDLKEMKITTAEVFSSPTDLRQSLRWISLVTDRFRKIDVSGSTGIHDSESAFAGR
ncbi:MAG: hypothetical protein WC865_14575 [Bacteroidales bacterium]